MQETMCPRIAFSTLLFTALTVAAGAPAAGDVPPRGAKIAELPQGARSGADGIPFGLFGMPGRKLIPPFTAGMQQAQPEGILKDLAAAKARGARVIVSFVGGDKKIIDAGGHFDFDAWKRRVDRFVPMAGKLNTYVADGTLLAALVIDEPFVRNRWGGEPIPKETVDQMGQYIKSLFPDLLTTVGAAPSAMQGYSWQYLDMGWAQYAARKGTASQYVSTEVAAAQAQGLGLIAGLNISKGGDGSSGFGQAKEWSMTGKEILDYGHALLAQPYACMFISWDYRPAVVERPDVWSALQGLADAAGKHPATPCRQKGNSRTQRSS